MISYDLGILGFLNQMLRQDLGLMGKTKKPVEKLDFQQVSFSYRLYVQ